MIPSEEQSERSQSKLREEKIEGHLDMVVSLPMSTTKIHIEQSNALYILDEKLKEVRNGLSSQSHTVKYWCLY